MSKQVVPQHIAVIMDGNGRWAEKRFLPRKMGHKAGAKAVRELVENCARKNVKVLTLFAFSSENWNRPDEEVNTLMELFFSSLEKELPLLQNNNIRLQIIGDRTRLANELQQRIEYVERNTKTNSGMRLVLAVSYGGRWDITNAFKQIAKKMQTNDLVTTDINEELVAQHLSLAGLPDPDLLIRTSGEQRVSNFLIWQLAYTELYFTKKYWPDFDAQELELALKQFANRERRFGLTSEQLSEGNKS